MGSEGASFEEGGGGGLSSREQFQETRVALYCNSRVSMVKKDSIEWLKEKVNHQR